MQFSKNTFFNHFSLVTTCGLVAALFVMAPLDADAKCLKLKKNAFVYAIGSSTMGISLGPALDKALKKKGVKFRKWAKASSGLARPDFHDWPKQVPDIVREWKPDAIVISLGTNDYQAMFTESGWIKHTEKEKWKAAYAKRVDRLLKLAAGPDKERPIVWVGPTPFNTKKGRNMSTRINGVIKSRIKAFGGNVHYIDMVSKLMPNGKTLRTFKSASGKTHKVYGHDGVHLRSPTVREFMVRPVVSQLICK